MVLIYLHQFFNIRSVRFTMSLLAFSKEIIIETPAKQHVTLTALCVGAKRKLRLRELAESALRQNADTIAWSRGTHGHDTTVFYTQRGSISRINNPIRPEWIHTGLSKEITQ